MPCATSGPQPNACLLTRKHCKRIPSICCFHLQIIVGEACRPKTAKTWQNLFALALALLTAGSCLQLGLSSNVSLLPAVSLSRHASRQAAIVVYSARVSGTGADEQLPRVHTVISNPPWPPLSAVPFLGKQLRRFLPLTCQRLGAAQETLKWLSNPASQIDPNVPPPGLENWDPAPYLAASLPISISVFVTQMAHEVGHRVVAALRKVRVLGRCPAVCREKIRLCRALTTPDIAGTTARPAPLALFTLVVMGREEHVQFQIASSPSAHPEIVTI